MLSWRLWQSLHNPLVEHPAFDLVNTGPIFNWDWVRRPRMNCLLQAILGAVALVLLIRYPMLIFLVVLAPAVFVMGVMAIPIFLPFLILIYGSILATMISNRIRTEKRAATYDLLCVLPTGSLGMTWLMSMWALRQGKVLGWLYNGVRIVLFLMLIGIAIIIVIALIVTLQYIWDQNLEYLPDALRTVVEILAIAIIFYTGFFQTIVISALIGMLTPHFDTEWYDTTPLTITAYLVVQIGTYFLTFWVCVALNAMFYGYSAFIDILLPVVYCAFAIGSRELIVMGLWRYLVYRLNATQDDIQHVQLSV
ncbi:hypothetical protein G4Y79_19200 [Phototrophicus methaneseepsis]|uniref:Uncharacterized protein n=1 Tax=Phototrophicus methaneseepsis TaxID=2710758 RepID=A0A7S8E7K6_9CHLR|nr:hypothetical protein [Phototrophicus methaneseepsis]QPC81797.1 hypothetical protein G4Y79_19200 [Phototrophicus methaneseepsis]